MSRKKEQDEPTQRLVAYYRYSGGSGQSEQSIEGQRRDCESYARAHGLKIQKEYIDRHISGKSDNRAAFQQMIADSDKHCFDMVICWKTDRLARNRYDSAIYKNRLRKNGVKILYAAESTVDGPEGIILEGLMESLAEYYSVELSQKLRRGQRESALKGHVLGGGLALGLTSNKEHEIVIDEKEAPTVRWIFEQYAAGKTAASIMDELNAAGQRTSRGKLYSKSAIMRIITNEQYIGVYTSKAFNVRLEDAIPPIIDKELWFKVQEKIETNREGRAALSNRADYLLSGKLFCGCCKTAMKGVSGTGKSGDKYYYYSCPKHGGENGCEKHNVKKDFIEDFVVRATAEYILAPGKPEQIVDQLLIIQENDKKKAQKDPEKAMLENDLADVRRKLNNLLDAIENGTGSPRLTSRLADLEQRESTLAYQLSTIQAKEDAVPVLTREQLLFMIEQFRVAPNEQEDTYRRRVIDTFISSVYLTDETALIEFNILRKDKRKSSALESVLLDLDRFAAELSDDDTSNNSVFDRVARVGLLRLWTNKGISVFMDGNILFMLCNSIKAKS